MLLIVSYSHCSLLSTHHQHDDERVSKAPPQHTIIDYSPSHNRSKRASVGQNNVVYPVNYLIESRPPSKEWQDYLVAKHNEFRGMVPAQDMRYMFWDDFLAQTAQLHANRCDFRHSNNRQDIGENIWASARGDYSKAVELWYVEVFNKRCGCGIQYKHCCGHYTQVVWAETYRVGCGAAKCRNIWGLGNSRHRHVLVCHYNPAGNTVVAYPGRTVYMPAYTPTNSTNGHCSKCPVGAEKCWSDKLCY